MPCPNSCVLCVGLGHGPGACSSGEVGGSSACQSPQQNVTLILGGRDAFCLVWLISVRVKPSFIGIAAEHYSPVAKCLGRDSAELHKHSRVSAGVSSAALGRKAQTDGRLAKNRLALFESEICRLIE